MNQRALHISSVDRVKIGRNMPEDFTVKFNPQIYLDQDEQYSIALDKLSMTFS